MYMILHINIYGSVASFATQEFFIQNPEYHCSYIAYIWHSSLIFHIDKNMLCNEHLFNRFVKKKKKKKKELLAVYQLLSFVVK